jgi:Tfp pilus assembly protein PilF
VIWRVITILSFFLIGACTYTPYEPRGPLLSYEEHIELATIYEKRGETGLALREYKKAVRGYYLDAEDSFRKAIELDPNVGVFYNNLGWLYLETNRPIMADSVVRRGLVMDPIRSYIYLDTLGVVETRLANFGEAERLFNEALVHAPLVDTAALFHIYTHLLELYLITGDEKKADEAKDKIEELRRFEPFFPFPRLK